MRGRRDAVHVLPTAPSPTTTHLTSFIIAIEPARLRAVRRHGHGVRAEQTEKKPAARQRHADLVARAALNDDASQNSRPDARPALRHGSNGAFTSQPLEIDASEAAAPSRGAPYTVLRCARAQTRTAKLAPRKRTTTAYAKNMHYDARPDRVRVPRAAAPNNTWPHAREDTSPRPSEASRRTGSQPSPRPTQRATATPCVSTQDPPNTSEN